MSSGSVGGRFSDSEGLRKLMFRERLSDLPRDAQLGNVNPDSCSESPDPPTGIFLCARIRQGMRGLGTQQGTYIRTNM